MFNNDRRIRFMETTLEELLEASNDYKHTLLTLMENDTNFISIMESKKSHMMSKKQLEKEAKKLVDSSVESLSNFGKAVLKFLAGGSKFFIDVCICIVVILMGSETILAIAITLIIAILLFAVTIVPFGLLVAGLSKIDEVLGDYIDPGKSSNVKKVKVLVDNIKSQKKGVKDVKGLDNLVAVTESLDEIIHNPSVPVLLEAGNVISMINSIEKRIETFETTGLSLSLDIHSDLAPSHLTYSLQENSSVLESVEVGNDTTDTFMTLEDINTKPLLSTQGLLHGIISITTEACDKTTVLGFLNRFKDTVKYELVHESYSDLPIMRATKNCLDLVSLRCSDLPDVLEACNQMDQLLGEIVDEACKEVNEEGSGFSPNPFSLGSLTPFPVGERKVGEIICDVFNAETDDEITEAMLQLTRVSSIINENYYVEENEGVSILVEASTAGKIARKTESKANQKFSKVAMKDRAGNVKTAVKKTIDPMEKFIDQQYTKLKEKDAAERREVIIKGGCVPKVMRWIKRGIKILILGAVGQVIPAAAIISGITFIGYIATDKYLDRKERAKIMRELEDEIMICNEKIDDSRGDDNKQKKYELMRIRNNLTRTRDKIRFGLKD